MDPDSNDGARAGAGPDAVQLLRALGRGLLLQPRGLAWLLPAAWALTIWWLSSQDDLPSTGLPLPEWLASILYNCAHPVVFGLLALFSVPLLPRAGRWVAWSGGRALALLAGVTAYGLVDEWHQSSVIGRTASLFDTLSDAVGAAAVLVVVAHLSRPDATRRGVVLRLVLGALACLAAATLSSASVWVFGGGVWFTG